jgi:hypothetical protein
MVHSALDSRPESQLVRETVLPHQVIGETYVDKAGLSKALREAGIPIEKRSIDRWVRLGTGPIVTRIGGRPFFKLEHIQEWLKACEGRRPCRRIARESKSTSRLTPGHSRSTNSRSARSVPNSERTR